MKFIGREQEQKTIQRLMSKEGYQGCVIYGRRRMGKTELVRKCVLEKKPRRYVSMQGIQRAG